PLVRIIAPQLPIVSGTSRSALPLLEGRIRRRRTHESQGGKAHGVQERAEGSWATDAGDRRPRPTPSTDWDGAGRPRCQGGEKERRDTAKNERRTTTGSQNEVRWRSTIALMHQRRRMLCDEHRQRIRSTRMPHDHSLRMMHRSAIAFSVVLLSLTLLGGAGSGGGGDGPAAASAQPAPPDAQPAPPDAPTVVVGTGDPDIDVPAVQAAVDQGGDVILQGHFSFDRPPTIPLPFGVGQ